MRQLSIVYIIDLNERGTTHRGRELDVFLMKVKESRLTNTSFSSREHSGSVSEKESQLFSYWRER